MTSILVVGDFSPQERLARLHERTAEEVFGDFLSAIRNVDLAMLNLEAPLCDPVQSIVKTGPSLHGPSEAAGFIASSGFGLVCLANNHIMDYGPGGLTETMTALGQAGVPGVGAGKDYAEASTSFLVEAGGHSVAVLNFSENEWSTTLGSAPGACPIDPVRNFTTIQEAHRRADHVLVVTHGGHERHPLPSPGMQELFRFYIDAGADAVVNHHTHCTSGYEIYKRKPIFYSLGNFLFDNKHLRSGTWTQGMAVELDFADDRVDFQLFHFDQCTETELFRLLNQVESDRRKQRIMRLNEIIADLDALAAKFSELASERQSQYQAYLEPKLPRLIGALQRRGWLPSLLSQRHRTLLLNLIRCESHREIVTEVLRRDAGHPR